LIAFYLPQFHPIKENDEWWGKGFTEWSNVVRAKPNFKGHYQPHLPSDLGFYDLRVPEVMEQQVDMAKKYGISGFCYYYYWFNGHRLLERPLDNMLKSGKPNFPFCICWANENWTRRWDGSEDEVLIAQKHTPDTDAKFIRDVIPILKDQRYIRLNGKPILLVYRINLFPDPVNTVRIWRNICAEEGLPSIHLCAVQSFGISDPRPFGFDSAVEFPPHTERALVDPKSIPDIAADFNGYLEDYIEIVHQQITRPLPDYPWHRGIMPGWDNTARRGKRAHILINASISAYEIWLRALVQQTLANSTTDENLIFINAWNEWAEGNHLEPDKKHGYGYLEATRRALNLGVKNFQDKNFAIGPLLNRLSSEKIGNPKLPSSLQNSAVTGNPVAGNKNIKTHHMFSDLDLNRISQFYRKNNFPVKELSYATVSDFCDSVDHLRPLSTLNGDLKDCQRPWALKAILSKFHRGSRILEIGAGEPIVGDILTRLGYKVWIVDPYDGSGNGPRQYEQYRRECPQIKFIRDHFTDKLIDIEENGFDCIYSISVLEHIPRNNLKNFFAGLRKFITPEGLTIHAIDHVHKGRGANAHLSKLKKMIKKFGLRVTDLDAMLEKMSIDTETYYLSAEGHNRWRAGIPYDQFPMRVCVSIQICTNFT
jgi:2-polyprenyl-3-methyl-5-hydroxy-6-metoxy-1,4-benzoquinol methylase